MSSSFFSGEKAPREEAIAALMEELPDYTDSRFWVRFESDDTSTHLTAIIESEHSATTRMFKLKKQVPSKYMGWRLVIKSVPPDYIEAILLTKERE